MRWRRENPERPLEHCRRRHALRRAARRQALSPLTLEQKMERFALFGNACAYCDKPEKPLTVDHVLALKKGGHDEAPNAVPACFSCNSSKHTKPVEQWYRAQPFFDAKRWRKIQRHCPDASRNQLMMGWQL
jgi:5-methylcytosine-specific restriction endonuclease McrA